MEYNLQGNRFTGAFELSVEARTFPAAGGRSYGSWYAGAGVVEDRFTGAKYFFALRTMPKGPGALLPECLGAEGNNPSQIDLCLAQLALDAEKSGKLLPVLHAGRVQLEELVKRGFMPDAKGQMYLPGFGGPAENQPAPAAETRTRTDQPGQKYLFS